MCAHAWGVVCACVHDTCNTWSVYGCIFYTRPITYTLGLPRNFFSFTSDTSLQPRRRSHSKTLLQPCSLTTLWMASTTGMSFSFGIESLYKCVFVFSVSRRQKYCNGDGRVLVFRVLGWTCKHGRREWISVDVSGREWT